MLKNYLLVAVRNLKAHFSYSVINIIGLSISLASALVIGLWVHKEYSFDRHWDRADDIYRIGVNFFNIGDMSIGPESLNEALKEFPVVESVGLLQSAGKQTIEINTIPFEENMFYANDGIFDVFSFQFLHGNKASFHQPNTAIVSNEIAFKWFGVENAIGRTFELGDKEYSVAGVINANFHSHIPSQVFLKADEKTPQVNWLSASSWVYAKLNDGDSKTRLAIILDKVLETKVKPTVAPDQDFEEWKQTGIYQFLPISVEDIHLKSTLKHEPSPIGDAQNTNIFAGVGLLIVLLACINFINISTARATIRAKEVGVRKSMGSSRGQLIIQFLSESIVLCLLAALLALFVGEGFLILFEEITELELLNSLFSYTTELLIVVGLVLILGIVAGLYPALYISQFKPVRVLKGQIGVHERGTIRSGLVVFQFVISISLLTGAVFIFNQLDFLRNSDKGFDTSNVLVISNLSEVKSSHVVLKDAIKQHAQVVSASLLRSVPASTSSSVTSVRKDPESPEIWMQRFRGDYDMISTLGFRVIAGRPFDEKLASDSAAVLLNETAVKELGFEDPVGQTINEGQYRIVGVVSDFNFESLKNKVGPVMLTLFPDEGNELAIKFSGGNPQLVIDHLTKSWESVGAEANPNYYFLDENFERMVEKELILSKSIGFFTILAMIISCLGLYGLSAFTAERKTKEIGIRKVLGASVLNITQLLSWTFARPILLAILISSPIVYLLTSEWLANYAYRIDTNWLVFVFGGLAALAIGIATIASQSVKTALKNPVESLRNE